MTHAETTRALSRARSESDAPRRLCEAYADRDAGRVAMAVRRLEVLGVSIPRLTRAATMPPTRIPERQPKAGCAALFSDRDDARSPSVRASGVRV
jgi:hypothetical protein